MNAKLSDIRKPTSGQTLVEFALVVFLLMVVLFGITEFGRAWFYSNALTNGVRDGARFGSALQGYTSFQTEVRSYTFAQITSVIPTNGLVVTVTPASPATGDPVTVTAEYDFEILTGSIIEDFTGTRQLTRTATMRYQ